MGQAGAGDAAAEPHGERGTGGRTSTPQVGGGRRVRCRRTRRAGAQTRRGAPRAFQPNKAPGRRRPRRLHEGAERRRGVAPADGDAIQKGAAHLSTAPSFDDRTSPRRAGVEGSSPTAGNGSQTAPLRASTSESSPRISGKGLDNTPGPSTPSESIRNCKDAPRSKIRRIVVAEALPRFYWAL